jgi:hypothetical protein
MRHRRAAPSGTKCFVEVQERRLNVPEESVMNGKVTADVRYEAVS